MVIFKAQFLKLGLQLNPSNVRSHSRASRVSPPTHSPVKLDGFVFERVNSAKVLGVTISDDFKWNNHILKVTSKAAKRLNLPRQLKRAGICASDFVLFNCSTVRSVLEYACQVFHFSLPSYLSEELERIQKRTLRTIFPCAGYNSALKEAGIPSLYDRGASLSFDLFNDIVLDTTFVVTSSQVCSHQKLITLSSCEAIGSSMCQCAKWSALKNL